jgi:chromosome segregation ATPase
MTEKRYSDGTLAKWYYSQTNVISDGDNEYYLRHKESVKDWNYNELLGTNDLLDELNRLSDENEQLKSKNRGLQSELQIFKEDVTHSNLQINKLADENEQLKQAIAETEKMVQSTYDELTKLRCIKKNLGRIKTQWDWMMGAIQYD